MSRRRPTEPDSSQPRERPYRSHLRPACLPCRKRKSRCKTDPGSDSCLMCRVHEIDCVFPSLDDTSAKRSDRNVKVRPRTATAAKRGQPGSFQTSEDGLNNFPAATSPIQFQTSLPRDSGSSGVGSSVLSHDYAKINYRPLNVVSEAADESSHIVGPAIANDAQVLGRYLSSLPQTSLSPRTTRSFPNTMAFKDIRKSVLFTTVPKHPMGMTRTRTRGMRQCQIIEKLIEPCNRGLIDLYFQKTNVCFPLLDAETFKQKYNEKKSEISPALLSCLYANSMIQWQYPQDANLKSYRCPDIRFIWVQAGEALFSDLLLSPDISTVISVLLNVGGRPTTSMTNNSMNLASAVALSLSLGLNRDPSNWDIADMDKSLRIRVWWCLFIQDRWCSFAYGTPPLIQDTQHDVPLPLIHHIINESSLSTDPGAAEVFVTLCSLTVILGHCLQSVYHISERSFPLEEPDRRLRQLELKLDQWQDGLSDRIQEIASRGLHSEVPGAPNLRLAYLSVKLLLRRIDLDMDKSHGVSDPDVLFHARFRAQSAADDIYHFVKDLKEAQLADFWLPASAFILASTATLLLRCALEGHPDATSISQSTALRRAQDFLDTLRSYKEKHGWDLGDICLAQCAEVIEALKESSGVDSAADLQQMIMSDIPLVDELFPTLWDMFDTY